MKTKKLVSAFLISAALLASCSTTQSDDFDAVQNLEGSSTVIATYGKQTVSLSFSSAYAEVTTFKSSITKDDISFLYRLKGRTATSLTRDSDTKITIVIEGDARSSSGEIELAEIMVSSKAMANGVGGYANFNVSDPKIVAGESSKHGAASSYDYTNKFYMLSGSWAETIDSSNVVYSGSSGTYSVSKADEYVVVKLDDYDFSTYGRPKVSFLASSNDLGITGELNL